ncbi:MAG TPA: DNA repair protein RecO [Pyrinomonadaceae bacterium]|nr:DNA repair protein RecO [Pyrinomonadaceae bacterium]
MALLDTEAIVLRTYNLGEADKIVVCLTRGAGLVRAVARGCRKLRSRFGAALEPFTVINITCYFKEHQDLISLRQAEILKSYFNLASSPEILAGLAYIGDLVIDFSPPYQQNEKLFRMLRSCLQAIAASPADLQVVQRYFEIWLLRLEGFLPDLRKCVECDRKFTERDKLFIGIDLGLRCHSCSHGGGSLLSQSAHAQLCVTQRLDPQRFANESRKLSPKTHRELAELTHRMIGRVLERQPRLRQSYQ